MKCYPVPYFEYTKKRINKIFDGYASMYDLWISLQKLDEQNQMIPICSKCAKQWENIMTYLENCKEMKMFLDPTGLR